MTAPTTYAVRVIDTSGEFHVITLDRRNAHLAMVQIGSAFGLWFPRSTFRSRLFFWAYERFLRSRMGTDDGFRPRSLLAHLRGQVKSV